MTLAIIFCTPTKTGARQDTTHLGRIRCQEPYALPVRLLSDDLIDQAQQFSIERIEDIRVKQGRHHHIRPPIGRDTRTRRTCVGVTDHS